MVQTQGEMEKERKDASAKEQAETTKPGEKLRKTDPEAYKNTYNEDGSLKIKNEKPLAGGEQKEAVNLETATQGDGAESKVVDQGEGHPQSEGSDKVEVKHPKSAQAQDDANKPVKHDNEPGHKPTDASAVDQPQGDSKAGENMSGKEDAQKSKSQERREEAQKASK